MDDFDSVIQDFLVESYENLDSVDNYLLSIETEPHDSDTIAAIFRAIHTLKGTCGFLGFTTLEKVAHIGENLLSRLRDGTLAASPDITDALLKMVDAIREILGRIETTQEEGEDVYAELRDRLERLAEGESSAPPPDAEDPALAASEPCESPSVPGAAEPSLVATAPGREEPAAQEQPAEGVAPSASEPPSSAKSGADSSRPTSIGEILIKKGYASREDVDAAFAQQEHGDPRHLGEILVEAGVVRSEQLVEALRMQKEQRSASLADNWIRVNVELLDQLMNLVGELVLTRNQILQFQSEVGGTAFQATAQRLSLITSELQEGMMQTRMQPISTVWDKFPRVVRDVAQITGKRVRLVMEGKETELDKTIVEAIKDPLTHLVRNAIDHGIERAEIREQRQKNPEGCLTLRAFHEGGQVNIEIADDGGGIDPQKIRAKAIEKGVISAQAGAQMSDRELIQLIFAPGFSTAETVTNVSGRGVGMDVVKTNIEKIGGTIELQAEPGKGTTIRVKIPLTLAIIPALIVRCSDQRYAIPQVSLVELVRVDPEKDRGSIEYVHGAPVYRLRGQLLPVVFLKEMLRLESSREPGSGDAAPVFNIVVLRADRRQFGLVVDAVTDTQEIVVKPLGRQLKGVEQFAGATIMGDGKVALILDVQGLARAAHVLEEHRADELRRRRAALPSMAREAERLLVFSVGQRRQMAISLTSVRRLEEFPAERFEVAGNMQVVQYRGRLLPLLDLRDRFGQAELESSVVTPVIVHGRDESAVGFIVREIIDVVEESVSLETHIRKPGILGSAVIQGRVTDFLDPTSVIDLSRRDGTLALDFEA